MEPKSIVEFEASYRWKVTTDRYFEQRQFADCSLCFLVISQVNAPEALHPVDSDGSILPRL